MSADNGVYVLYTEGPEYRVAHAQAIGNIYNSWCPDTNSWTHNPEAIKAIFGQSKPYSELDEAWDAAKEIEQSMEFVEYGVCLLNDFSGMKFVDLVTTTEPESGA